MTASFGTTERVSVSSSGPPGRRGRRDPRPRGRAGISGDGRFVAFSSEATTRLSDRQQSTSSSATLSPARPGRVRGERRHGGDAAGTEARSAVTAASSPSCRPSGQPRPGRELHRRHLPPRPRDRGHGADQRGSRRLRRQQLVVRTASQADGQFVYFTSFASNLVAVDDEEMPSTPTSWTEGRDGPHQIRRRRRQVGHSTAAGSVALGAIPHVHDAGRRLRHAGHERRLRGCLAPHR